MALLPGSPATGAVPANTPGTPATDQRGVTRNTAAATDIGAFESQGFTLTPVAGSTPQTALIGTAFANPLGVIVTANDPVEPVNGGVVSFVANPAANGASALLSTSSAVIANGEASVLAEPNNVDGSYTFVASASGLSASFDLTNTGPPLTHLVVDTTSGSFVPGAALLSLPKAVAFANADLSGIATITFNPTVFAMHQTITLTGSQLELRNTGEAETITGPAAGVTVSGGGLSRVFQVDGGVTASISGLTITGGNTAGYGGGLYNLGTITLTDCTVSSNSASYGGGLDSDGTTTLTNCTVSGNSATKGNGGGLENFYGTTILNNCTVSGDSATNRNGGGIADYGGTTTLNNCTVSGNSASNGGGISDYAGTDMLSNCTVSGNSATANGGGGGLLCVFGTTTLNNCTVSGNLASNGSDGNGGGLECEFGTTTLNNCTVNNNSATNSGGGLALYVNVTTLTDCTVSGNSAPNGGGGLLCVFGITMLTKCAVNNNSATYGGGLLAYGDTTTLNNCTVSGNLASNGSGGGLEFEFGTTTLNNCTVNNNSATNGGGGLALYGNVTTLTGCTISGNSTSNGSGGGVFTSASYDYYGQAYSGTTTLTNCTISGNSATGNGGGLSNYSTGGLGSTTTLTNCTVSGNSAVEGGGIYNNGTVTIGNTIVAKNKATTSGPDALGTFASQGNNLIGETDGSSGWVSSDLTGTIAKPLDPLLAPLGNYGGPTPTMALLPGSPAIDAGNNALIPAGVTTDQRGLPRIVNGVVDIGAFESSGFTIKATSGSGQSTAVSTAFFAPLVVTVTANNPIEPVAGGLVTLTPPTSGASASLRGSPATISATGTASVTATANSTVGGYTVSATASGITTPASFSLTNNVAPAFAMLDQNKPYQSGGTIPITIKVIDALGNNVGSSSLPVVSISVLAPVGNPAAPLAPGNSQPDNLFAFDPTTGTYQLNLKTKGYKPGSDTLFPRSVTARHSTASAW